ncbi:MAG: PAS domain S-box protein [Acidobacteria bacterium]|nr:MAG: PAS domain S-box protein [Acidobacteriota bacterium]
MARRETNLKATFLRAAGFIVAYFVLAKLGVPMRMDAINASPIWLPTGLCLAAILLFGWRFWPVVALAVTARTVAADLSLTVGISLGLAKAAEVLVASYLMKGPGQFKGELDSVRAVLSLVLGAAMAGSIVGALTSTTALCSLGLAPWSRFLELSSTWWLGDAMGILIAVPAILFVSRQKRWSLDRSAMFSAVTIALLLLATGEIAFGSLFPAPGLPLAYLSFPCIFWASLRFRENGAALSSGMVSLHATIGTLRGLGPFARESDVESLVLLGTFLAVVVVTSLLLGAVIAERRKAAQALRKSLIRYNLASAAGSAGVWDWELSTNELYVDPVFKRILGYEEHEIRNHLDDWRRLLPPEDAEAVRATSARHIKGETARLEVEFRILHRDGSLRWFTVRGEAQRDASGRVFRCTGTVVDITDQKLAEEALEHGEQTIRDQLEELNHLYQTTPVGLCLMDRELRYVRINERLAAIHGRTVEEHLGRTIFELLPEIASRVEPIYRKVFETGEPVIDHEGHARDPKDPNVKVYYLASFYPHSVSGEVRTVSCVVQDITSRKRIEQELQESERKARRQLDELEHVYRTVPIGLALTDRENRYVRINERLATMNGRSVEEHIGRTVREVLPTIADIVELKLNHVLETGEPLLSDFEGTVPEWKGSALVGHYPLKGANGEVEGVGVVIQDVTALKHAERMQAANNRVLELVAQGNDLSRVMSLLAEDVETQTDRGCVVRLMEPSGDALRAIAAPSFPGDHDEVLDVLPVGSRGGTCGRAAFERREVVTTDITKDASWNDFAAAATAVELRSCWSVPILSSSEEVLGTVCLYADEARAPDEQEMEITRNAAHLASVAIEHIRAREALTKSEASLRESHEEITQLAARLIAAQEQERQRVSRELHDGLNQQLAALSFEIGMLRTEVSEEQPAICHRLGELQARAIALIEDARRISHELHPSTLEHLGLVAAIRAYCDEVSRRGETTIRFDSIHPPEHIAPPAALCLFRVVQEGVQNAAKHASATVVQVTLRGADDSLTLAISDDGRGFDTDRTNGGLGLVSMAERVRVLGGQFSIRSSLNKGTRLEVRLDPSPVAD